MNVRSGRRILVGERQTPPSEIAEPGGSPKISTDPLRNSTVTAPPSAGATTPRLGSYPGTEMEISATAEVCRAAA